MASPHHSTVVVAKRTFDRGKNIDNNESPARQDDVEQDAACQQQCAADVDRHNMASKPSCRAVRCTACDRQFASCKYLSMHMALHKMVAEPAPTSLPVAVPHHTAKRHSGTDSTPAQWCCPICHKTFTQNSNFRNHVRTHSDERPYVCLVCLIGFKERYHLKKHMLFKHSPGQLNEACRLCGKRFKDLTAVRAHEKTHSDVRPYACSSCDKMFKTSECLWHHQNRSKVCGRIAPTDSRRRPGCWREVTSSAADQSSSKRRQRCSHAGRHSLPPATSASRPSMTEATAVVSTRFVESSSIEAPTSSSRNVSSCDVTSVVKPETEIAELFDCSINALWKTTDGAALQSIYDGNGDVNFCTSANCFDNLMATESSGVIVNDSDDDAEVVCGCRKQSWNRAAPTDLSSLDDHRLQSSFAAFQTASSCAAQRPLHQPTSNLSVQHSGNSCVYDEQTIPDCSMTINAFENGRLSDQSPANSHTLVELAGTNGIFCGPYLPTAVVTPIKRNRVHGGAPSSRQQWVSTPTAKIYHLPPIESFAPRR